MASFEFIIVFTVIALCLQLIEDWIDVPLAIIQVTVGFAISFLPFVPDFKIDPGLAFALFIPPLVYWGALNSSVKDLTRQGLSISLLSIGLIGATVAGVAFVLHSVLPALPWAACCVVGAMVAPPDADIMTSVVDKLGLPQRVTNILQGESLTNDAPALVTFRWSLAALMSGTFNVKTAIPNFAMIAVGSIVVGYLAGKLTMRSKTWLKHFNDSGSLETGISLFYPFIVFIIAERLQLSGVLSVAVLGFMVIKESPTETSARSRIQITTVWGSFIDLIGGFLFMLVGFISSRTFAAALKEGAQHLLVPLALIIVSVIAIRLAWVIAEYKLLPRILKKGHIETLTWKETIVISWAGMRGGDTLVAALALPIAVPHRLEMQTLGLGVLMFTLLVEGLSLRSVIKVFGIHRDHSLKHELNTASKKMTEFMLKQIEKWKEDSKVSQDVPPETFENLRQGVLFRRRADGRRLSPTPNQLQIKEDRLELKLIKAARKKLLWMREHDEICDTTMRELQRDLDLQTVRFQHLIEGQYGV